MIHRLVFDTTDANTIAESSNVGAYVRSSDGTLIDHEQINAVERLSVDSTLKDGAGTALTSRAEDGGQALDVHVTGSGPLTINDAALANTAIAAAANTLGVADTPEDVVASPLANRKYLYIYNNGNRVSYIGQSGVSAANGFPLHPGAMVELRAGASIDIEWVSSNTSQELRTLELS